MLEIIISTTPDGEWSYSFADPSGDLTGGEAGFRSPVAAMQTASEHAFASGSIRWTIRVD